MHILTKVFVVIAAVLSVGLAVLAMTYALNADRITAAYNDATTQRDRAETAAEAQVAQYEAQAQTLGEQNQAIERQLAERDARIRELTGENVRLLADKRDAEAARDSIQFQIEQQNQAMAQQLRLIETYGDEVRQLRDSELAFRREKLALEDRINDLQNETDVLRQAVRGLQEQLADTQRGETDVAGSGGGELQVPVTGEITEVMEDVNGRTLARLDLGTNDGLAVGIKLFAVRGERFLANLAVVEADLNSAVVVVDTLGRDTSVRSGDRVLSRLQ